MIICNLKRILDDKKISVIQLSKATGINRRIIYNYMSNDYKLCKSYNIKKVSKICNYLRINLNELLGFTSLDLSFYVMSRYTKSFIDTDSGNYWVHLVLLAVKVNQSNSGKIGSRKPIGYFNFDAKITADRDSVKIAYQVSESIPLYQDLGYLQGNEIKPINQNAPVKVRKSYEKKYHLFKLSPIPRDYLQSIVDNKHNLGNCAILPVSLHNNSIIKHIFKGTILSDPHSKNSVRAIPASVKVLPVAIANGYGYDAIDPSEKVIDFRKLPYISGKINLNADDRNKDYIQRNKSVTDRYFQPATLNDKRDQYLFSLSNGLGHLGGNGLNRVTDRPYQSEMFYRQLNKEATDKRNALNKRIEYLENKLKRIVPHNAIIRKRNSAKIKHNK